MTLRSLTDDGFTLTLDAAAGTEDTIVFEGHAAVEAIVDAASTWGVGINNPFTQLGRFDVMGPEDHIHIGFNEDVARATVGNEFADIVGGGKIDDHEVLDLFVALTTGGGWGRNGGGIANNDPGLDGVELIGADNDSFAIAIDSGTYGMDYILFENVHTLDGADGLGFFGDPAEPLA